MRPRTFPARGFSGTRILPTHHARHSQIFSRGRARILCADYTSIVLSFLMVFFGIQSYRDNIGNGQITFLKAFAVGISITLISCICYVLTWEIIYYNFLPGFWDKYGAHLAEKLRASGASAAAVQAKLQQVRKYKELYKNPLFNAALTFIDPFPIGLVITLISALVLRRKPRSLPEQSPLRAS